MKQRILLTLLTGMLFILAACTQKTALRFSNETECGAATITLTNTETGNIIEKTVNEGETVEIEITPNVEYHYEVQYPRQPNYIICDAKRVTTLLEKGQTLNISLQSVRDPSLEQPTPTGEE